VLAERPVRHGRRYDANADLEHVTVMRSFLNDPERLPGGRR
jgi:hypothetical protein